MTLLEFFLAKCVYTVSVYVGAHVKQGFVHQSTKPNLFAVVFMFATECNRAKVAKRANVCNGQLP